MEVKHGTVTTVSGNSEYCGVNLLQLLNIGIFQKMKKMGRNTNLALHRHQGAQLWVAGLGVTEAQRLHPNQSLQAPL